MYSVLLSIEINVTENDSIINTCYTLCLQFLLILIYNNNFGTISQCKY